MAASRSIKFELIGYSPVCLCSFQNWGSRKFSPFRLRRKLSAYSFIKVVMKNPGLFGLISKEALIKYLRKFAIGKQLFF